MIEVREFILTPPNAEPVKLVITIDNLQIIGAYMAFPRKNNRPIIESGLAFCHPGDKFDRIAGMKLAVKRACNIGGGWDKPLPEYYSEFRRMLREGKIQ